MMTVDFCIILAEDRKEMVLEESSDMTEGRKDKHLVQGIQQQVEKEIT